GRNGGESGADAAGTEARFRSRLAAFRAAGLPPLVAPPPAPTEAAVLRRALTPLVELGPGWEAVPERFAVPTPGNVPLPHVPLALAQAAYGVRADTIWNPRLVVTTMTFAAGKAGEALAHFGHAAGAWPAYEQTWGGARWWTTVRAVASVPDAGLLLAVTDRELVSDGTWEGLVWAARCHDVLVVVQYQAAAARLGPDYQAWVSDLGMRVVARLS
ncbi:MAG: hypothetical protein ACRDY7_13385, partial [Acidimicrobiia bacterium]